MSHSKEDLRRHLSAQIAGTHTARGRSVDESARLAALSDEDHALEQALQEIDKAKDFIFNPDSPGPSGSPYTVHGENAEQVTVALLNANDILNRELPNADFGRARGEHAIDYYHGELPVQSKYCSSTLETLREISDQLQQYPGYSGVFHIPKDQHLELVELHSSGTTQGYDPRIESIRKILDSIEQATGRSYLDGIRPGQLTYEEAVRLGELTNETRQGNLDPEQAYQEHNALAVGEWSIRLQSQDNTRVINSAHNHLGSLQEMAEASSLAAIASGGVEITRALIAKYRAGKNPFKGQFSPEDWSDVGLKAAKRAATGSVLGGTVYQLTSLTSLAAPFAASLVSAVVGMKTLHGRLRAGTIDERQFVDLAPFVVCEAAIVGLSVAAGQVMVPIPLLGTLVGGIAGRIAASLLRNYFDHSGADGLAARVAEHDQVNWKQIRNSLDEDIARLDKYFGDLDWLAKLAFDPAQSACIKLRTSVDIGRQLNVPEVLLVKSTNELNTLMAGGGPRSGDGG